MKQAIFQRINMNLKIGSGNVLSFEGDVLVIGAFADGEQTKLFESIDGLLGNRLSKLMQAGEFSAKSMKTHTVWYPEGLKVTSLIVVGLGTHELWKEGVAYQVASAAAKVVASSKNRKSIAFGGFEGDSALLSSAVAGSLTGGVGQDTFKAEPSLHRPESIEWFGVSEAELSQGRIVGESINLTRKLVNLPANYLYPNRSSMKRLRRFPARG